LVSTQASIRNFQKKCGLFWEEKAEAVEQLIEEKKLTLKEVKSKCIGKSGPKHRIIEADNLAGLTYLLQQPERFKLIYIDPPYNTGNKDFKYNDHYVDEEDELRHSKWVSFMYKRLSIAKELLEEDGAIFISIDDYEQARLKMLCDGIFGQQNFVANFIRKNKAGSGHDSKQVAVEFDYMLCYAKNIKKLYFKLADAEADKDKKYRYSDDFVERRGKFYLRDLDYKGSYSKTMDYPIRAPDGNELWSGGNYGKPNTWRWNKKKFEWGVKNDYIVFKKRPSGWKVYIKQYQFVDNEDKKRIRKLPQRALIEYSNSKGSNELKDILQQDIFSYPKPTDLICFVINLFEDKNLNVLDFFAGSGSTLHATMLANHKDGGNRNCTLITNNENEICEEVTYPRNRKVIEGYETRRGKKIKGLTKNQLSYYKLQFGDE
jgi:adenine-specific DNA-methyltransferase